MNEFDGASPERLSPDRASRQDNRVYLSCVKRSVRLAAVLESPHLMAALVQDTCLRIAVGDWFGRLPSRRHPRARARWAAEGAFLRREEQRLTDVTDQVLAETPEARPEEY